MPLVLVGSRRWDFCCMMKFCSWRSSSSITRTKSIPSCCPSWDHDHDRFGGKIGSHHHFRRRHPDPHPYYHHPSPRFHHHPHRLPSSLFGTSWSRARNLPEAEQEPASPKMIQDHLTGTLFLDPFLETFGNQAALCSVVFYDILRCFTYTLSIHLLYRYFRLWYPTCVKGVGPRNVLNRTSLSIQRSEPWLQIHSSFIGIMVSWLNWIWNHMKIDMKHVCSGKNPSPRSPEASNMSKPRNRLHVTQEHRRKVGNGWRKVVEVSISKDHTRWAPTNYK